MSSASPAVFLDRDGTLIQYVPYLRNPEAVVLTPGAAEAIHDARARGWKLFLFSNQSGVGRKLYTLADVEKVNRRMFDLLGVDAESFTDMCIATDSPETPSLYRKPSPRFILESIASHQLAKARCWMVGDNPTDWKAGLAAGIQTVAIRSGLTDSTTEIERIALGVPIVNSLPELVAHIDRAIKA